MTPLLVLPDGDACVVARADGDALTELWRSPPSFTRIRPGVEQLRSHHWVQAHEGGWVSAAPSHVRFLRARPTTLESVCTVTFPALQPHAVAMRGGAAYIGGEATGGAHGQREVLYVSDREPGPGATFRPVEVPDALRGQYGKGIDAMVLDGDTLLAVDNVYEPLYFLLYDVSDPFAPRLTRTIDFSREASMEKVVMAALSASCLAVLSSDSFRTFIRLYERGSFSQLGFLEAGSYQVPEPRPPWQTLAWSGDRLYVAAGADGVGVLDLGRGTYRLRLDHVPAPSGGPVLFLTKGSGGFHLHTPGRGGVDSEWMPIG